VNLFVVVEGDSEERFVNGTLRGHLLHLNPVAIKVKTGKRPDGKAARGGGSDWTKYASDIRSCLKSPGNRVVTTMIDVYRLPANCPGRGKIAGGSMPPTRIDAIEAAIAKAINDHRFIPFVLRHEFETLVLASLAKLESLLPASLRPRLASLRAAVGNAPEDINCGPDTAPSKRLARSGIGFSKAALGVDAVHSAGIAHLKSACPRFRAWVNRLETL
jgi:hypothetical protein